MMAFSPGRFLARLDQGRFLNVHIWDFSYRSLPKEYARAFFFEAVLAHPWKTVRGLERYRRLIGREPDISVKYHRHLSIPDEPTFFERLKTGKTNPLIGLGFCLKPIDPGNPENSCPSGRANHDCLYLERSETHPVCSGCAIFRVARRSLDADCPVYIMTSAEDIARDFLFPQIESGAFPSAVLLLCPFSVQAIILPLLICGVDAFLIAYASGACRDYQEWRRADLGTKPEQTWLDPESWEGLIKLLRTVEDGISAASQGKKSMRFRREGNIFHPVQKS
jgi:hypothetical protein